MRLYHGTSLESVNGILNKGINPRHIKNQGNWEKFPSKEGYVYLTNAYALYFAISAVKTDKSDIKCAIFEVETDFLRQQRLCPDEDFIGQVRSQQEDISLEEATNACIPLDYRHHWKLSLEKIGNCCYYGKIPPNAITRYAIIDLKKNPSLAILGIDPTISILNYSIMSQKYTSLLAHIFDGSDVHDEREMYGQLAMYKDLDGVPDIEYSKKVTEEAAEYKKKMQEWRKESVTVFDLTEKASV
jgi:hypothetical protein